MKILTILFALLLVPALAVAQSQESSSSSSLPYDWKSNCRLATAAALPAVTATSTKLTAAGNGALSVDSVACVVNDRVLVKDQAGALKPQNGLYRVTNAGSVATPFVLSRDSDGNEWRDYPGSIVAITSEGTANKNTSWRCTAAVTGVLGTTDITYENATGSGGATALQYGLSDEDTDVTAGQKLAVRMPYACTLTGLRASSTVAPTGQAIKVDIKNAGTSILTTVISIDAAASTSVGSAAPPVILTSVLTDDMELTFHITQIGSIVAGKGLKVTLYVTK